jgi:oligopeptide/dipeptide ABC transporter ATP-binding protein
MSERTEPGTRAMASSRFAAPRIRSSLRKRPPARIRQARGILSGMVGIVILMVVVLAIGAIVLKANVGGLLPGVLAAVAVAVAAFVAARGFRDGTTGSLVLGLVVALVVDGAALWVIALVASAGAGMDGNTAFGGVILALGLLVLGVPLLLDLVRGRSWFLDRQDGAPVITAAILEAESRPPSLDALAGAASAAAPTESREPLISVRGLKKHFPIIGGVMRRQIGTIYAVDGVDFDIYPGEVFSLVGESGCGKTTLGRTILQLIPPTAGTIVFDGYDLSDVDPDDMRPLRRRMQIIFQDPFGSLNPRMPVSDIIGEGLVAQGVSNRAERDRKVEDSLEVVGLRRDYTRRYPHEFSGGQRQRIGVARALALGPDFIVCDEPVSALDVSIQSQVLNLLLDLRRDYNLTYLFISHNLSVVQYISDRVGVMYLGRIVELGTVEELYRNPRHPYTIALLSAIPVPDPRRRRKRLVLRGDVPSPAAPPSGCRFHTRCWLRERLGNPENCVTDDPPFRAFGEEGHRVACHWAEEVSEAAVSEAAAETPAVVTAVADEA